MPAKSSPSDESSQNAYLYDRLESARHVMRYMAGVSFEDFWSNSEKRDAVSMRLAVIGESARHINKKTAAKLPTVPFDAIRGMRNRIAHEYGQVDYRIVWQVAREDIEPLVVSPAQYLSRVK